jgi:hypothetical protein
MHEDRQRKAREIEERLARIRAERERSSVPLIVAGLIALALAALVAIQVFQALV